MNIEKRIRKSPQVFPVYALNRKHKQKPLDKKQRLEQSNYAVIGLPPKYQASNDIYLLPGNIPCSQKNDESFVTELSWLNEFHVFREIETLDSQPEKSFRIHVERRTDSRFPRLKNFTSRLLKTKKRELRLWGRAFKDFCQSCKDTRESIENNYDTENQIKLEIKKEEEIENFSNTTLETQPINLKSTKECFIQLKSYFRGSENHLAEIIVNESFVRMLGYNPENFCSLVLSEGLPELFAVHDEHNSQFLETILKEFNNKSSSRKTPFIEVAIKTKTGYVKKTNVQVQFKIEYRNGRFESETCFNIPSQESLFFLPNHEDQQIINDNFMQAMEQIEQQANTFMQSFYNTSILSSYTNQDRICRIKEL